MLNTWKCCVCFVASKQIKKRFKSCSYSHSLSLFLFFPQWIQTVRLQLWTSHMGHGSRLDSEWTLPWNLHFYFFHECHQMQLQKYWLLSDRLPLSSIVWTNWFSPQTHTMSQCWVGLDSQCVENAVINNNKKSTNYCMCILCCNKIKYFKIKKCTFQL